MKDCTQAGSEVSNVSSSNITPFFEAKSPSTCLMVRAADRRRAPGCQAASRRRLMDQGPELRDLAESEACRAAGFMHADVSSPLLWPYGSPRGRYFVGACGSRASSMRIPVYPHQGAVNRENIDELPAFRWATQCCGQNRERPAGRITKSKRQACDGRTRRHSNQALRLKSVSAAARSA